MSNKVAETICPICYRTVKQNVDNGRPKVYCSERCKGKAKRRTEKDRAREAMLGVRGESPAYAATVPEPILAGNGGAVMCHVCNARAAVRGSPAPLLCEVCAAPS